jgi:uncharacterized protein YjbI with pentapeptide repeats
MKKIKTISSMSQFKLVFFVSIFITFSLNSNLLTFILLPSLNEDLVLVVSFLFLLTISFIFVILVVTSQKTIKPILIIFLLGFSVFTYALNNFDLLMSQNIISENSTIKSTSLIGLINPMSFFYFFILGLMPSYFLLKIELIDLSFKNLIFQKIKILVILILIFILLAFGLSKLVDFPLKHNNPITLQLINISKTVVPIKNYLLKRDIEKKIAILQLKRYCSFCNLSSGDFKGKDLSSVDLSHAQLTGADLSYTNLSGAKLRGADLRRANITGANLSYADLEGAKLDGLDLSNKNLTGAIFNNVDLRKVDLKNSNLSEGSLVGANLKNIDLTGTILPFSNLINANLEGVDLRFKDLTGVSLNNVDLKGKDLTGVNLSFANLTNTIISGVDLSNKDLRGAVLSNVDLTKVDLTNTNLNGAILKKANLSNNILSGTILSAADLSGANLYKADLRNKNLSRANLSGVDLTNQDLNGTNLTFINLSDSNLNGVNLSNMNLTGVNLSRVDLSYKDFTNTILTFSNFTGANLSGVNLRDKDLTGVVLTGVNLDDLDLTGATLKNTQSIEIAIKDTSISDWPGLTETQNLNVTRYDLSGSVKYMTTKEGLIFELIDNNLKLVFDLKNNALFPSFDSGGVETGLLGVASQNDLVYIAYTNSADNNSNSLVVDELSSNFKTVRNVITIENFASVHFGGNLLFDSLGSLYLSVGDGDQSEEAQNLNSLKGKILRLDTSKLKRKPEIIAYGLRNPWGVSVDSKDRMFVLQCGRYDAEAVYLLNEIYSDTPSNLGWPVFEGSLRKQKNSLTFDKIKAPIFEYRNRPGCATAGVYIEDLESFLFADFFGTIRLIKQQDDNSWYLLHEDVKEKSPIWGFGFDKKSNKIYIAPNSLELEILVNQVKIN